MDYNFLNKFIWGNENNYLPTVPNQDALNIMGDVLPKDLLNKRGKKKKTDTITNVESKQTRGGGKKKIVKENAEELSQESELSVNNGENKVKKQQKKENPFESEQENNISEDYEEYNQEESSKPVQPPVVIKKNFFPNEQESDQDEEQLDEEKNEDEDSQDRISNMSKESIMHSESSNISDSLSDYEKWEFYQELYKFDLSKGLDQFLKLLNLEKNKEKLYKFTDLFYPYDKNEYDKVVGEINSIMQPRFNENYQSMLEQKREKLLQFLEEIKTTKKEKDEKSMKQKETIKFEQQQKEQKEATLTIEFVKRPDNLYYRYNQMIEESMKQPAIYAKVSSAEFIKSLYEDVMKNYEAEQNQVSDEKTDICEEKIEKVEEAQVSFRKMSFSLNEENKKQFVQPFKKVDTPMDTPNFDLNAYFEGLDSNETPTKPQLKTPVQLYQPVNTAMQEQADNEKQVEKQKEEVEFLEQIQKKIKLNNGLNYWKACEVNECLFVKTQPIYKFSLGEPINNSKDDYFGRFENELLHKYFYFNEELFNIEALYKAPKERYQDLVIDLNDNQLFYEKIHGQKYRRNNYLKRQQQQLLLQQQQQQQQIQQNQRNDIMEDEVEQSKKKLSGEQEEIVLENLAVPNQRKKVPQFSEKKSMTAISRTESKQSKLFPGGVNQMNEQQKNTLKKLRIQLVKQGMDPRAISQNHQALLKQQQLQYQQIEAPIGKEGNELLNYLNNLKNTVSISKLQHSPLAESFKFNNFLLQREHSDEFHRCNYHKKILKSVFKRWWQVQQSLQIHKQCILGQTAKITIQRLETKITGRQNELVDSGQRFRTLKHLSAREGVVTLIEFIEENPLIMQNPGMSSKIVRYVQSGPLIADSKAKDIPSMNRVIEEKLGPLGSILVDKRLPLLGQLNKDKIGCVVMENNLYKVPLWKQRVKSRDFLLVKTWDEERECFRYFIRKVNGIYVAGQIEPSLEVYSPNSRFLTNFIKKCLNFQIKHKFKENGQVSLNYLKTLFPSINDHGLRKSIKDLGGEQDLKDQKVFKYNQELIDSDKENENQLDEVEMSPEEVCLYEKKHWSQTRLRSIGLKYLKLADKINLAKAKYNKANQGNLLGKFIAQLIAEELQLTSWNLTQSYINAKKSQGRLCLTGFGDPTNGHGGISFVKQPLKISRHEKDGIMKQEATQDQSQPSKTIVTGTSADLRRLKMIDVKKILIKHGYNGDHIEKLQRWEKIELLRELSNKLGNNVENDDDKEILKFARSLRETTKMQREKYQKDINKIFSILYNNLSITNEQEIQEKIPPSLVQESMILGDKQPAFNLFQLLFQKEKEKGNKPQKNIKQNQDINIMQEEQ